MAEKKVLYLLSGLGADERVFKNLCFNNTEVFHLHWIEPLPNETLRNYALRLSGQIKHENCILGGLSFGGILALEIAGFFPVEKIILFSSVKSPRELPWYFRWAGKLALNKLLPSLVLQKANRISYWFFGANTPESKQLLSSFMRDSSLHYLRWSIGQILTWKGIEVKVPILHIHGRKDRVLPARFIKTATFLPGGHFMVFENADEVNAILESKLAILTNVIP